MSEQVKTLWLLECMEGRIGRLLTFYAKDSQEAETLVYGYLASRPQIIFRSLTCKPRGFTIMHTRRPGKIICKE